MDHVLKQNAEEIFVSYREIYQVMEKRIFGSSHNKYTLHKTGGEKLCSPPVCYFNSLSISSFNSFFISSMRL